jgi:hypothetical protein
VPRARKIAPASFAKDWGYTPSSGRLVVYLNDGSGGFDKLLELPGGVYRVAAGDFDRDGRPDFFSGGQLYRNNFPATNAIPSAPIALSSVVSQSGASLNWLAASDANQNGGLTYNLRVGVFPGDQRKVSPLASSDGTRHVVQLGNTGSRLGAMLTNIGGGTFYWSVQAIDHAGAGSAFAPEQTFTLPAVPPKAATSMATNVTATSAGLAGFADSGGQPATIYFDYGLTTNYGSQTEAAGIGPESYWQAVSAGVSNLAVGGTYHFRLVVVAGGITNFGGDEKFTTPIFTGTTNETLPSGLSRVAWGDFDGDGDLDCVLSDGDFYASITKFYRNDGAGNLIDSGLVATNFVLASSECADFDGDGLPDILLISPRNAAAPRILCSNGDGTFRVAAMLTNFYSGNLYVSSLQWADYDHDGDPDILYHSGTAARLFRNDGNDKLVDAGTPFGQLTSSVAAWGDFDGDGYLDAVVAGLTENGTNLTRLYLNTGTGNFIPTSQEFLNFTMGDIAAADWDNDGDLDLVMAGFVMVSDPYIPVTRMYRNDGGIFVEQPGLFPGLTHPNFSAGDYDNDGQLDLFVTGNIFASGYSQLWRNTGGLDFVATEHPPEPGDVGIVSWADFDADGDLDYFSSRYFSAGNVFQRITYLNNSLNPNIPPASPGNLSAMVTSNSVTLAWDEALDANQGGGLSYNLRIGSAPDDSDVMSPLASAASGWRRVAAPGNVKNQRAWSLRNLPPGNYYWSVQSVDHTYAGSPFAAEQTFVIDGPPTLSDITNAITLANTATPPIPFTVHAVADGTNKLVLTAWAENPDLVPTNNIVFAGSNRHRTITISPAAYRVGKTTISVQVTDALGRTAVSTFTISVQGFVPYPSGLTYVEAGANAWADFNSDGWLDAANNNRLYRNDGGIFTNLFSFLLFNRNHYAWSDYDRDGDLDLVEAGLPSIGAAAIRLFRNDGGTNFVISNLPGITNGAFGAVAWGDFDNDGDEDLLITGHPGFPAIGRTQLLRNTDGVFVDSGIQFLGVSRSSCLWMDFDNDGDWDLLISGQTGTTTATAVTRLYRNDGNSRFVEIPTTLPNLTESGFAAADFDRDGSMDLAVAGFTANTQRIAAIYRGLGNGVFNHFQSLSPGISAAAMAWGDIDGDGYPDLVMSGQTNTTSGSAITRIFRNERGASFTDISAQIPGTYDDSASWGDFDNDGDLDLMVGPYIYRNIINAPPPVLTSPDMLTSTIEPNNEVRLVWHAMGTNDSGGFAGVSFNLRLGISPGGSEIIPPNADLGSGKRRLPKAGNAGTTNFWRISDLPNGTYYWSVQTIDASLRGSAFAAEASFTLSRPSISSITNYRVFPNTTIGPIDFSVSDAETEASNLVVTVTSSNPNLFPPGGQILVGADSNYTLTLQPQTNRSGQATISIVVADESGQAAMRNFEVVVERFAPLAVNLGPTNGAVAWIDFDRDGDLDLSIGSLLFQNNGADNFTAHPFANSPANFYPFSGWGDADNDGDPDWMFGNSLFVNLGGGLFTNLPAGFIAANRGVPAWADADNDGRADLLYPFSDGVALYRNHGSNVFSILNAGLPYLGPGKGELAWGDYDNDGDADLLVSGVGMLRIYQNNGRGAFVNTAPAFPGFYDAAVAWGDFNNDGLLDFIVAGSTNGIASGAATRIYLNRGLFGSGAANFTNVTQSPLPELVSLWRGAVAVGDYDGDGWLDLVLTGEASNGGAVAKIYRNEGGRFIESGHLLEASKGVSAAWGDFDRDGNLDLVISGGTVPTTIYKNYAAATDEPNRPASVPSGLSSLVNRKSARLSWSGGVAGGLSNNVTYNLRVGRTPGGTEVVSPLANSNGLRYVSAMGNINGAKAWTITNLIGGTYYWSVQAIDHAYAGSAFAPEQSFIITNATPTATTLAITLPEDSSKAITLAGTDSDGDALTYHLTSTPMFGQVTGTPPTVVYRPVTNYAGYDQFTYIANDRTTNSLPATVFLTITPVADVTNTVLGINLTTNGFIRLDFWGEPWQVYQLDASEDLIHWTALTNFVATNLLMQLVDRDAANFPRRFYRAAEYRVPASSAMPAWHSDHTFSFTILGQAGRSYQVQASTNLVSWSPIGTVFLTNNAATIVDDDAGRFPLRFYRIR